MTGCVPRRGRARARALPVRSAALAAVASLVLVSCGGSPSGNGAGTAAGEASDGSGAQAGAQPDAEQRRDAGAADAAADPAAGGESGVVAACTGSSADRVLPQGRAGLGFDGRAVGMVEVFEGSHRGSSGQSTLRPVRLVPESALSGWAEQPVVGGYVLELLDRDGAVVHSEPVRGRLGAESLILEWEAHIAERPAYRSYRIRHQGRTIVAVAGSAHAPRLSHVEADLSEAVGSPDGYLRLRVRFNWTACDPDAGPLFHRTYYSIDGGSTYSAVGDTHTLPELLRADVTAAARVAFSPEIIEPEPFFSGDTSQPHTYSHDEAPWNLPRGDQARFLVVVSDGVRWSAALSEPFEPAPHPPTYVSVREPVDGAVFRPQEEIRLRAATSGVLGRRWRDLPQSMFHWSSDIDGEITPEPPTHTDDHGQVPQGLLTPGTHRITATATDAAGNTGSATVTIEIRQ